MVYHIFFILYILRKLVEGLVISHRFPVKLLFRLNRKSAVLECMRILPFIKGMVHITFYNLTMLINKTKPVLEEFSDVNELPPSIKHLWFEVVRIVKVL